MYNDWIVKKYQTRYGEKLEPGNAKTQSSARTKTESGISEYNVGTTEATGKWKYGKWNHKQITGNLGQLM